MNLTKWFYVLPMRFRSLFNRNQVEQELEDELRYHLDMKIEENAAKGLSSDEARRSALVALGGLDQRKEECRDARGLGWLERILQDICFAFRLLSRNVIFAVTCIVLMACTIGLSSAALAILDVTVLRKLPVPHPEELVVVSGISERGRATPTPSAFDIIRRENRYVSQIFGASGTILQGSIAGLPQDFVVIGIRGDYFGAQGAIPQIGRLIGPDEHELAAVISDDLWHRSFSAAPDILNRTLAFGKVNIPIIGVARPEFRGIEPHINWDIILPRNIFDQFVGVPIPGGIPMEIAARLRPGSTAAEYEAQLKTIWPAVLQSTLPPTMTLDAWRSQIGGQVRVDSLSNGLNYTFMVQPSIPRAVKMTFWLSLLIFCAGCLTLALMALAHALKYRHHTAIMLAIGGQWRILRVYFIEMFILSVLGCATGLFFAAWWSSIGESFLPSSPTIKWRADINSNSIALALAMGSGMALLGGIVASLFAFRTYSIQALYSGSNVSPQYVRLRLVLLTTQLALSVVLVYFALVYAGDLSQVSRIPIGFDTKNLHTYSLVGKLPIREISNNYLMDLIGQIRELPGVESASITGTAPPLSYLRANLRPVTSDDRRTAQATGVCVFPDFFSTLRLPMRLGRDFSWGDRSSAIVTSNLANELYSGGDPLTHSIKIGRLKNSLNIVGVVGNVAYNGPRIGTVPVVFFPCAESVNPMPSNWSMHILVRSMRSLADLGKDVAAEVERLGVHSIGMMTYEEEYLSKSMQQERMLAAISVMFGGSLVLLAAVGLYAFSSYLLALRTKELAIRSSLGAGPLQIAATLVREAAIALVIGSVIGIALTFAGRRVLSSVMQNVSPPSIGNIIAALLVIAGVTLAAVLLPIIRALRMDLNNALRVE